MCNNSKKIVQIFQQLNPKPGLVLKLLAEGKKDDEIAKEIETTPATVRKHIQNLCDSFKIKEEINGIKVLRREALVSLYKKYIQKQSLPSEFNSLINEKIKSFCGRQFVFDVFSNFINNNTKGYFTVIGDAGMGKSSIAAKYVYENGTICYFNNLQENRNSPQLFLESIRKQFINRYQLANVENADLSTLLIKTTEKLSSGEKLIIVVDALDEVNQEPGGQNILYLPKTLPDHVYFFLTRRRFEPNRKRLYTEGMKQEELDLTDSKYDQQNWQDIQDYIRFCLENDSEYKTGLQNWIRTKNITHDAFINELRDKSEKNFMYLRYVLPAIAEGKYNNFNLTQLPQGLQNYYQTHWERMNMNDSSKKIKVMVLFILVEIGTPIPCEMIVDILNPDEFDVQDILDEWIEYLKPQPIDGDTCYSIYHASFLDFLKAKRELNANRQLFKEVNQCIVDYWGNKQD